MGSLRTGLSLDLNGAAAWQEQRDSLRFPLSLACVWKLSGEKPLRAGAFQAWEVSRKCLQSIGKHLRDKAEFRDPGETQLSGCLGQRWDSGRTGVENR